MLLHNYTYLLNEDGYEEKRINNISVCIITKYLSSVGKCLFMLILNTIYNDYCGNNVHHNGTICAKIWRKESATLATIIIRYFIV